MWSITDQIMNAVRNGSNPTVARPVEHRGRYGHVPINEMLSWPEGYISFSKIYFFIADSITDDPLLPPTLSPPPSPCPTLLSVFRGYAYMFLV